MRWSGVLTGAGFAQGRGRPGSLLWALDVEAFQPRAEFLARMDAQIDQVKQGERAPGVDELLVPGERGERRLQELIARGVLPPRRAAGSCWRRAARRSASRCPPRARSLRPSIRDCLVWLPAQSLVGGRELAWARGGDEGYFGERVAAAYDEHSGGVFDPAVCRAGGGDAAELAMEGGALEFAIGPDGSRCRSPSAGARRWHRQLRAHAGAAVARQAGAEQVRDWSATWR